MRLVASGKGATLFILFLQKKESLFSLAILGSLFCPVTEEEVGIFSSSAYVSEAPGKQLVMGTSLGLVGSGLTVATIKTSRENVKNESLLNYKNATKL